jgi:protein O-mannosyl-transferase
MAGRFGIVPQRHFDYQTGMTSWNRPLARISSDPLTRLAIPGALIVLMVVLAYLPALRGGFVWDDGDYVTNNQLLHSLKGLWQIWSVPSATPQYYPLSFTSFWVDYHLWQLHPLGYHLVNVLLQALNAILLWTVLRRLNVPGAWLAAAIFAVHPVNVETVAWVTERKNMLAGFFYLCSALACLRFWLPNPATMEGRAAGFSETSAARFGDWKFYWPALFFYSCALLAKTAVIALPVAVLLVVWWKRGKIGWRELLPLAPFLAVGMAMGLWTVWVEKHLVHAAGSGWALSFPERCLIAGRAVWCYLGKLVWPHPLIFIYQRWEINTARPLAYLPILALVASLFILWLGRRGRTRPVLVTLAYFLALLFPVMGFFNVYFFRYSFVADHFQYLAGIGPLSLAAAGITLALDRFKKANPLLKPVVCGALLLLLGALTWRQCGMYSDLETLWRVTLSRNPASWLAHNNLGDLLLKQKRIKEAFEQFQMALQIKSDDEKIWFNLGDAFSAEGQPDKAIKCYRQAIQINPNYFNALNNLGSALAAEGRFDEAAGCYLQAKRIEPTSFITLKNLASAQAATGRLDEAIENYRQAIQINAKDPDSYIYLGMTLSQLDRNREAIASYRAALKLNPDLTGALNNLALILATSSDDGLCNGAEAVQLAERACQLTQYHQPLFIETLAAAYAEAGRFEEAQATVAKAGQLALDAGLTEQAERDRRLLELYRAGQPLRKPLTRKLETP